MKRLLVMVALVSALFATAAIADDNIAGTCAFNGINYKLSVTFVNTLKAELQKNNKQAIAGMASFPLQVNEIAMTNGKEHTRHRSVKDKHQFLREYDSIMTENMRHQIINDQDDIFCNYQGAMIAGGMVWFNTTNDKPTFFSLNIE